MNRGSRVLSTRPEASLTRFNEAPIHESGKFEDRANLTSDSMELQ